MITKIEARTSAAGMLLSLPLEGITDGVFVEEVLGLDPVKATLVSSSFANLDGAQFQSSRRETRNIILTLGIEPTDYETQNVRTIRTNLYSFFMPKSEVKLRFFMDDGLEVDITGRVESFETPLFVKDPQVVISIMCFDPDFIELDSIIISEDTVSDLTTFLISYPGTVETGILLTLLVDRALTEFTIYHTPPDGVVRTLDFAAVLQADDVLTINTVVGSKAITLTRSAVDTSLLYGMSPQSAWIELFKGNNQLRVFAEGAAIPFTIEYTVRYGGL